MTSWIPKMRGYQIAALLLNAAAIISMYFLPWTYIVGAVIFYIMIMPLTQLIFHEYFSHLQIKPKNQLVTVICMWIFCVLGGRFRQKFLYHQNHHQYWKQPELDLTQKKIKQNGFWAYVFGVGHPVPHHFTDQHHPLLEADELAKFFNRHANLIQISTVVVAAFLLPLEIFAVVFLLYPWMLTLVFAYHDWRFHGPNSTAQDASLWFPLFANQTWHVRHHTDPHELYFGPGYFKWFNISWYFYKTCFRPA